jgi:hypothetical protein
LTIYLQPIWADREIITLVSDRDLLQLNQAEYVGMAQWNITDLSQRTTSEKVGGTSDRISQVAFTILVKRRYGFYIWMVFVPLLLMVTVSWTIFWMRIDDFGNQIPVAITTILTVIAFAFSLESNLPKVPYVTYIDAFFLCCYFFVFLTVIELMAVNIVLRTGGRGLAIKIRRSACWSVPFVFAVLNAILIPHFFYSDENPNVDVALGGGDLVAEPFLSHLALELRKREQHIQSEFPHEGRDMELLDDRHQRTLVHLEQLDHFREVGQ